MRQPGVMLTCVAVAASLSARQIEPRFEVASVKENTSGSTRYSFSTGLTKNALGRDVAGVGIATVTNAPLREIIARAYGIEIGKEASTLFGEQSILEKRF